MKLRAKLKNDYCMAHYMDLFHSTKIHGFKVVLSNPS